jgi:hypothetical protein
MIIKRIALSFINLAKNHTSLVFLIPYAFIMVFLGLSNTVLQTDEGGDTFISSTILKYGIPYHQDEINSAMEHAKVREDGLFIYRTWIPYYLQAGSLLIFGKTTFAARVPFASLGVISAIALYFFTLKLIRKKNVAFLATLFLISSVPALIYFRTARYVGLPILLTTLLLYSYITIFDKKKWSPWPITIISIIYFHTMYVSFAGIILGILVHFYINRKSTVSENYKRATQAAIITAIFTLPWLWFIFPIFERITEFYIAYGEQIDVSGWRFLKHFAGFIFQLNNYIFPFILLPLLLMKSLRTYKNEILLCLICTSGLSVVSTLNTIPFQQYLAGSFPLLSILLALIIVEGFPIQPIFRSTLTATLIFTNLIHVGPLLSIKETLENNSKWFSKSFYMKNTYKTFMREVKLKSVFHKHLLEISNPYKGPLDKIVVFFKTNGKPSDSCYIDNEHESLAYYTGMKVINRDEIKPGDAPNWIVLRGDYRHVVEENLSSPIAQNLRKILSQHSYSKIVLDAPSIRVNNTYDIQIHKFLEPSSPYKVIIYKLDHSSNNHNP